MTKGELSTIWLAMLFGLILGLIFAASDNAKSERTKQTTRVNNPTPPDYQRLLYFTYRPVRPIFRRTQRNREENSRSLVENWRRSIVGLVRLAEENLASAEKTHFEVRRDYRTAVELAFTGVENISRALIHCYGGKPDSGPGQEEALKLLSQRFQGDERTEFEKAIDSITRIDFNKIVLKYASTHNVKIPPLDEKETRQILKSASNVVSLFKRMITDHFATEIPELQDEACMPSGTRRS